MLNQVKIIGTVCKEPQLLYTNKKGQSKYQFFIECKRNSGNIDTLPVITINPEVKVGERVIIHGVYSSFNQREEEKSRLKLNVYAQNIELVEFPVDDENNIELEGIICKTPIVRTTPLGRVIADILIAINRPNSSYSDYIPVILWGYCAKQAENINVGNKVKIKGRVQSRIYTKEEIEHTAYEISASNIEILEN